MFIVTSTDENEVTHDISCHTQSIDAETQLTLLSGVVTNLSIVEKDTYTPDAPSI